MVDLILTLKRMTLIQRSERRRRKRKWKAVQMCQVMRN